MVIIGNATVQSCFTTGLPKVQAAVSPGQKHGLLHLVPKDFESTGAELSLVCWISKRFPGDTTEQSCWSGNHILKTTASP